LGVISGARQKYVRQKNVLHISVWWVSAAETAIEALPNFVRERAFRRLAHQGITYYVVASSAPRSIEPYRAPSMYFYSEPQLVEPKGRNVTGLRLALNWDKGTLRDIFEKK
jgi:hypothetical protein